MKYLKRILYRFCVTCRPHGSRTVRYAFSFTLSALVFMGAAALLTDDTSYIRISTTNSTVSAGEFFSVNVYAGAAVPVNTVDIAIQFPEDQIEIEGIDTGESVITIWAQDPYVEGGTIYLQGGTFRKGFLGEHLIANINARARESGVAKFTVDDTRLLAGDGSGRAVTIDETGYESLTMYVDVTPENTDSGIFGAGTLQGNLTVGIYTDINGDGEVNMNDIVSFMSAWRNKNTKFDFNNDGKMSFVDFGIILADSFFK